MRFPGGAKIRFNSEMNLHRTALKPTATTLCQLGRLGHFCHAQNTKEKRARFILLSGGHCQLNVINGEKLWSTFRDAVQCFLARYELFLWLWSGCWWHEAVQAKIHRGHSVMVGPTAGQAHKRPGACPRFVIEPLDILIQFRVISFRESRATELERVFYGRHQLILGLVAF